MFIITFLLGSSSYSSSISIPPRPCGDGACNLSDIERMDPRLRWWEHDQEIPPLKPRPAKRVRFAPGTIFYTNSFNGKKAAKAIKKNKKNLKKYL
jgi:hypothetical protein